MTLLANELIAADLIYGLYSEILRQTEDQKALYRRTWGFWLQLLHSLLNDTVLTLGRLYDVSQQDPDIQHVGARVLLRRRRAETHHALGQQQVRHCGGLMFSSRCESGMEMNMSRMQRISMGNSVRNRLNRSNFRCMK